MRMNFIFATIAAAFLVSACGQAPQANSHAETTAPKTEHVSQPAPTKAAKAMLPAPYEGMPEIDPNTPLYIVDVNEDVGYDDLLDSLITTSEGRNMNVVNKLDIGEGMRGRGIAYESPYLVLEVCNLGAGAEIIKDAPEFGAFAPCKIVIYEKDGGLKMLTYRPTFALNYLPGAPKAAAEVAQKIEDDILYIMKQAREGAF